jgi:hypothetical protein
MKMVRSVLALLATVIGCIGGALAFGPYPLPTAIAVAPAVPKPSEQVVLTIADTLSGLQENGGGVVDVQVTRQGTAIAVVATLAYGAPQGQTGDHTEFEVRLGTLPEGRYTVDYSSNGSGDPAGPHRKVVTFTVASSLPSAIEYFNPQLGHYFYTSYPDETASLDRNPQWMRTGESFHVIAAELGRPGLDNVCRFYGLPEAGLDSHFFTRGGECYAVKYYWPTSWLLETDAAFMVPQSYQCGNGTVALYRLYNNRTDANHRYTTSPATRDGMTAQGWILEGSGLADYPSPHAMCIPE